MAPGKYSNKRRALSTKNVNQLSRGGRDTFDRKQFPLREDRDHLNKDITPRDISLNSDELEANKLQSLQFETSSTVYDIDNSRPLTKANLKILQGQLFRFEALDSPCEHNICSSHNMTQVTCSRNWFLFELELTRDGTTNFRNDCYHTKVYKKIDPTWMVKSCLTRNKNDNPQLFELEHLLYTPIDDMSPTIDNHANAHNESIDIDIYSILEEDQAAINQPRRALPHSMLFKRNKKKVFEDTPVHIEDLHGDSPGEEIPTSNDVAIYFDQQFPSRSTYQTGLRSYFKHR